MENKNRSIINLCWLIIFYMYYLLNIQLFQLENNSSAKHSLLSTLSKYIVLARTYLNISLFPQSN